VKAAASSAESGALHAIAAGNAACFGHGLLQGSALSTVLQDLLCRAERRVGGGV
jgi:hypothetical protein